MSRGLSPPRVFSSGIASMTRRRRRGASSTAFAFGVLTLAGAGGIAAPAGATAISGGTATGYSLAAGIISPTTNGSATAGTLTFTGSVVVFTMSTIAAAYSVTTGELAAVVALGQATIDGKTVYGRPGADIVGAAAGSLVTFPNTMVLSTGFTITSHSTSSPCYIRRINFRQNGPVTITFCIIRDTYRLAIDSTTIGLFWFSQPTTGRSTVTMDSCQMYASDDILTEHASNFVKFSGSQFYSGDGAGAGNQSIMTLVGSADNLTQLDFGAAAFNRNQSGVVHPGYNIGAMDNAAKTVTLSNGPINIAVSSASPQPWKIGNVTILRSIQMDGMALYPSMTITNCNIHDIGRCVNGIFNSLDCQWNTFTKCYSDFMTISPAAAYTSFKINNNTMLNPAGSGNDGGSPHPDFCQFDMQQLTAASTIAIEFIGNVCSIAGGRAIDMQGLFIQNYIGGVADCAVIARANLISNGSQHGISVYRPNGLCIIEHNIVLGDTSVQSDPYYLQPQILTDGETGTAQIRYNVTAALSFTTSPLTSAAAANNYLFGAASSLNTNAYYAGVMAGTDFSGATLNSKAAMISTLASDNPGALITAPDTYNRGPFGYYDFGTGVFTRPSAAVPGTPGTADWSVADRALPSGGTIRITFTTRPSLNYGTAVEWEYRKDAGAWTATGVVNTGTFDISGLTDNVQVSIDVRYKNSIGSGTGSSAKLVTPTTGVFVAVGVEFDGTDWIGSNAITMTGAKTGIISVFLRSDAGAWPTSGYIWQGRNAGGTERFFLACASSGRLNFGGINAAGTTILARLTATSEFTTGVWYHNLIAFDLATTTCTWYKNDVALSGFGVSTTINDTIETSGRFSIGADTTGAQKATIKMSELYVNMGETLDMTISSNRRKFYSATNKPVYLGVAGATPTGIQPEFFYSDTWASNLGGGGALTLTGTLAGAGSSPSD